ncbi:putative zinc-binding protein [Neptunicella sp.]|uniref:putative zinc-binding protein n=1 Tax=Neptunicella sp. TaxID=2125986 RepID=UPI003F693716
MKIDCRQKTLVYACSGCSNLAQLANDVAVTLDREGSAQMSCIAGVGGKVKPLVRIAKSGRPILAIDGCPLMCVKKTLSTIGVSPEWHIELTSLGYKKIEHQDYSLHDAYKLLKIIHHDVLSTTKRSGQCSWSKFH